MYFYEKKNDPIFLSGSCHVLINLSLYGTKSKTLLVTAFKSGLFLTSGFLQQRFLVPESPIPSSTPNRGIWGQGSPYLQFPLSSGKPAGDLLHRKGILGASIALLLETS